MCLKAKHWIPRITLKPKKVYKIVMEDNDKNDTKRN